MEKSRFHWDKTTPIANPLTVIKDVRQAFEVLVPQLPSSLRGLIVYDATEFIRASINEVMHTNY